MGYYIMPFCEHNILGFEAHLYSGLDNKEMQCYLSVYDLQDTTKVIQYYIVFIY